MSTATVMSYTGANLRDVLDRCRQLGCNIWRARRTGELVVQNPDGKRVRINSRRKDAPRSLTAMLGQLERLSNETETETANMHDNNEQHIHPEDNIRTSPLAMPDQTHDEPENTEPLDDSELETYTEDETEAATTATAPPTSLADRLAEFQRLRDELFGGIQSRLAEIDQRRTDLLTELDSLETEAKSLHAQLRQAGVPVLTTAAPAATHGTPERETQQAVRVFEYLQQHGGVWFSASHLRETLTTTYQISQMLKDWIDDGAIERRGENRGTQYRMKAA